VLPRRKNQGIAACDDSTIVKAGGADLLQVKAKQETLTDEGKYSEKTVWGLFCLRAEEKTGCKIHFDQGKKENRFALQECNNDDGFSMQLRQ